jgi:hypothetical protein
MSKPSKQSQGYVVRIADVPGWLASGDPVANWFIDDLERGMASPLCMCCGHKFTADTRAPTFFFFVMPVQKKSLLWDICGDCSALDDMTLAQKGYDNCLKPVLPKLKLKGVSFRHVDESRHDRH